MNSLSSYSISTGAVAAGSIRSASVFTPNFVFFGGTLNELLFTPDGMKYRGEVVNDAGAAHAIITEVLGGSLTKAQGKCGDDENRVTVDRRDLDILQTTIDQVWIEAMQAASRLVIKMTGIPLDALQAGRGVRDRIVEEGENIARAIRRLGRGTATARPPSSAPSIHPSVWLDPAMNLLREARDSIVDFGPRGTQLEIIADIDKVLKRGVTA